METKQLFLADLAKYSEQEVRAHLTQEYGAVADDLAVFDILVAYESVGSWGCDSESYFLLRKHGVPDSYFEVRGSHCSCYGFEGQFSPEACDVTFLKSEKHYVYTGGYDDDGPAHRAAIRSYLDAL